ncbi:hypothetical protein V5J35_000915 [Endozoicomonas sp. NE40]|uniref:Uncharacterized protein n=1 Tax=Endozoicomonas lisbonensis TaxID=3120522 RepID=A0ABV2SD75_9GAMM
MRFAILVCLPVAIALAFIAVWHYYDNHLIWLWMSGLMLTIAMLGGLYWYVWRLSDQKEEARHRLG